MDPKLSPQLSASARVQVARESSARIVPPKIFQGSGSRSLLAETQRAVNLPSANLKDSIHNLAMSLAKGDEKEGQLKEICSVTANRLLQQNRSTRKSPMSS